MKRFKNLCVISIAVFMVLLLSGCATFVKAFESKELRNYTDVMLNAVLENDSVAAYSLVSDICSENEFEPIFNEMHALLKGVESYELKLLSINKKSNFENGKSVTKIDSVYEMIAGGKKYVINVVTSSKAKKLSTFYITPYEKTNLYYTGVIENMKDASLLQWGFLLSNLLFITFMIVAVVDCCRHQIKLKPLWIAIIILGAVSIGATISASRFNLNFNLIWGAAYTAFVRYGGGQVALRFVIPWGVVLYFILRHWLIKKPEQKPLINENIENTVEE